MLKTITQRELRNGSAAVMDAVENGETILVTRNGNPVAELRPVHRRTYIPTAQLIHTLLALPRPNYVAMREEADRIFGEDRLSD